MTDSVIGLAEHSRELQDGLYGKMNVMVQTPSGLCNPPLAIAASRAGACGVLSLDVPAELGRVESAITDLLRFGKGQVGVKVRSSCSELENIVSLLDGESHVIVLIPDDLQSLQHGIEISHQRGLKIFLEATRPEHEIWAEKTGVAGIIAKGNEAGGWVSDETSLILLQTFLRQNHTPVWVHGGIGLHTIGACLVAGAAGVVLDSQLALTRESALPDAVKSAVRKMDGSETLCLGEGFGAGCRIYHRPGQPHFQELQKLSVQFAGDSAPPEAKLENLRAAIEPRIAWNSPEGGVWLLGQDAAFAAALADRYVTVGGVLEAFRKAAANHISLAASQEALRENAPLARLHHTTYPIVQGPMTRVSDRAEFCESVAAAGALPMLALALMRGLEIGTLLKNTQERMGSLPWGVGILGFVPVDLRKEQIEAIRPFRPPFAIIAGGRPDQALDLEKDAISTYLHVPSPGLLQIFLEGGCRKFVFEGRECGGHVGPRTSFVLWDLMIDTILNCLPVAEVAKCQVLFAGGIHDSISGAMAAAIGSPLVEKGARIGILMGTAYLFTREAVETGGIVEEYQTQAIQCSRTILLESGPGHSTRCVETPFCAAFRRDKERLFNKGLPSEAVRQELEKLNVGRLRIASKGLQRNPRFGDTLGSPKLTTVGLAEQRSEGLYMIGQVAALRDKVISIRDLHKEVSDGSSTKLRAFVQKPESFAQSSPASRQADVAIIGMSCLLPKAKNLQTYWENILNKVDAITEIPKDRWDWRRYYDPDPKARDKVYSRWGGFIDPIPFDPLLYGMPPKSIPSIEPLQLLVLEATRVALEDAGYASRPFPRQKTSVILGAGGGVAELGQQYAVRSALPSLPGNISAEASSKLPEWTEDSFPGILLNVAAGRIANRFDLGGVNYTVDAACASSLAAVYLAVRELETGTSDLVIVGGADTVQSPFAYLCFSKSHALSPRGRCRTFDDSADGIVISEGIAMLVLKRLDDAERDGDRIYAVIKAVAGSSDGKAKGLTAPRPEGQALALERAYAEAGFSAATVGLIEAHGTGTVAGDQAEVETLTRILGAAGATRQSCAIGSVKSMIGHSKCTAGVAGLIKVALALHHKVLPPTLHVEKPTAKAHAPESPPFVNIESRPWIQNTAEHPRRAGVSAFGFGGTNFHAVLEEYSGNYLNPCSQAALQDWPCELLLWAGNSHQELSAKIASVERALERGARPLLRDLAFTSCQLADEKSRHKLALVATSLDDLRQKLAQAREALQKAEQTRVDNPKGVYFSKAPLRQHGRVCFLFPGQGSQYPDMLSDLAIHFAEVRESYELADRVLASRLPRRLSSYVFSPPHFSPEEEQARQTTLAQTNVAQPAVGAASMGLFRLLQNFGVQPDMVAGHSYGEYTALCSAGVFEEETLYKLSEARGRCILEAAYGELGTMAAVTEGPERLAEILKVIDGVSIANLNAPRQTVISGTQDGITRAMERLSQEGVQARRLPVACAFHSPLVAAACERLAKVLSTTQFQAPRLQVFSNTLGASYSGDPNCIKSLLTEHLIKPVRFVEEIETIYRQGARIFVEVGPRNVLTGLLKQILDERDHLAIALDVSGRFGLFQLQHSLAQLAVQGVSVNLNRLHSGRAVRRLNLSSLEQENREKPLSPNIWLVGGARALPRSASEGVKEAPQSSLSKKAPISTPVPTSLGEPKAATAGTAPTMTKRGSLSPASVSGVGRGKAPLSTPPPQPVAGGSRYSDSQVASASSDGKTEGIMLQFQQLMDRFLETQKQVMVAYLRGSGEETVTAAGALNSATPEMQKRASTAPPESFLALAAAPSKEGAPCPLPIKVCGSAEPDSPQPSQPLEERERLEKELLHIVAERTGYPPEMLGLDSNLEADLGIDSIKRVEIVALFLRACVGQDQEKARDVTDQLSQIKTLREILEAATKPSEQLDLAQSTKAPPPGQEYGLFPKATTGDASGTASEVPRFLLTAIETAIDQQSVRLTATGVFMITEDDRGVAQFLAKEFRDYGVRTIIVRSGQQNSDESQDVYTANLATPSGAAELLDRIHKRQGRVAGIIHLLPLRTGMAMQEMDMSAWRSRLEMDVATLFCLTQAAASDLRQSAASGGAILLAGTSMGGTFGNTIAGSLRSFLPSQGGVTGLIKTLAVEWPDILCKTVDLDPEESVAALADHLLREMMAGDREVEVGYKDARRMTLRPRPAALNREESASLPIDSDSVIMLTGGARGITAEVACELAARYRPTLILLGRTPLPTEEEAPETSPLISEKELKAVLMDQIRREEQTVTPAQIEAAYVTLTRNREIRRNMAAMKQAGASVHYHQVDVRDEKAFGGLIDGIYESHGRIDGVVHGAGIIEDKLIENKAFDSFDRVFGTKVLSAFILGRKLRADTLRFLVFFSSVSGRFGNRGQADYAAANDVVNKFALYLDRSWPSKVVAINWGPWRKAGMVSAEVERQFADRAMQLIHPESGRRALIDELRYGRKGEVEVVLGGGPWSVQDKKPATGVVLQEMLIR